VTTDTLAYFSARPPQARRDSEFALEYVKRNALTVEQQQAVLQALLFKCDVLWSMLDALYHAYIDPKHVPPEAFVPQE
jgi:pyrroloquinoline-quinone synthase